MSAPDRIDAWGATLTEEQRWELYRAHYTHDSWEAVCDWAVAEFSIEPPTRSAYYRFRSRMAERESEHRIEMAITEKGRISREMDAIGEISPELKRAFEQRSLESELRGDHQGAEKWLKLALNLGEAMNNRAELALKAKAQERAENQLALMREKFEAAERRAALADRAETVASSDLTPEEREKKLKEIFGLK
jgi:hypothetical protein